MQDFPEITKQELIDNLEAEDFFARFGNPVRIKAEDGWRVIMSCEMYEGLYSKEGYSKVSSMDMEAFASIADDYPKEKD